MFRLPRRLHWILLITSININGYKKHIKAVIKRKAVKNQLQHFISLDPPEDFVRSC